MRRKLAEETKRMVKEQGADLVGIAPVERFRNAPLRMSPQGHLPAAKSVVVFAIHHLDAAIELGGEPTPHDFGPYALQSGVMNPKLDSIAFRLALFLEEKEYQAIPMPVTNIWRYSPYKDVEQSFAPDLVHRYAAVAAGLGEIGWSGLFLSPEYGPRQRINSVITDAELEPTPMYDGSPLCDRCMECVKACPTQALKKEFNKMNELEIGGKIFRFPDTNKWRCAWAENFALNLELPIPEKVDKEVILENLAKHGRYRGEVGSCLRYCMVPELRYKDPAYTRVWRRKREIKEVETHHLTKRLKSMTLESGMDALAILTTEELGKEGINIQQHLPDARNAIILGANFNNKLMGSTAKTRLNLLAFQIAQYLEKLGFSAAAGFPLSNGQLANLAGIDKYSEQNKIFTHLLTAAPLEALHVVLSTKNKKATPQEKIVEEISKFIKTKKIDLWGISSVDRIESIIPALKKIYAKEEIIEIEDKNRPQGPYVPEGKVSTIQVKHPRDYLKDAQSVIVLGIHYPNGCLDRATKPPAEAAGPYAAHAQWQVTQELSSLAFELTRLIEDLGYKAVPTLDLCGIASHLYNPRGAYYLFDTTANRFAAVAAGLGELGWHGVVLTPKYGVRQRFIAIVTNASLKQCDLYEGSPLCRKCYACQEACPVTAISQQKVFLDVEGKIFEYGKLNRLHCDWSKRYGLVGEEGPQYMGSPTNIMPPEKVTLENLSQALERLDPIQKYHLCIVEKCLQKCPAHLGSDDAVTEHHELQNRDALCTKEPLYSGVNK